MFAKEMLSPDFLSTRRIPRRDLIKLGAVGIAAAVIPFIPNSSAMAAAVNNNWRVTFRHQHTGESFSGVYRVGDRYLPEAFHRMNYVLRDFRSGDIFPMDPRVLDIIAALQAKTGSSEPLEVLSGYRCPKTNAMLREASAGVAKNSFHMYGQAIDIRLPGFSTRKLHSLAMSMKAGGVGYYPRSNFVHVDTGTVRSW